MTILKSIIRIYSYLILSLTQLNAVRIKFWWNGLLWECRSNFLCVAIFSDISKGLSQVLTFSDSWIWFQNHHPPCRVGSTDVKVSDSIKVWTLSELGFITIKIITIVIVLEISNCTTLGNWGSSPKVAPLESADMLSHQHHLRCLHPLRYWHVYISKGSHHVYT